MVSAIEAVLVPTLMILVGYLLKRLDVLKKDDSSTLNNIVINVALPCLVFTNISGATITGELVAMPFVAFAFSLLCMLIGYIYCRSRGYSKVKTWTIMLAVSFMNTAFIGYPVILGIFGNEGFSIAIFYDLALSIFLVVMGVTLSGVFGGNRREVIKNALTFMPLWGLIFGLLFNVFDINMGYVATNTLTYLGNATIPLIMISLGLTIEFRGVRDYLADSSFVLLMRLIVSPILMFFILTFLHFSDLAVHVGLLQAGMPVAMNALVLSLTYDLDSELMSTVVFISTILSVVTLPLMTYIF